MAIIFIAQVLNIDFSISQILSVILVLLVTSKSAAGVKGIGFVTLAATSQIVW